MLSITPLFVLLFVVMNIVILMPIGPHRAKVGVMFWGGEDKLDRLVRGHGNFIEFVPLFLVALATAEYLGTASVVLWAGGGLMLIGRLLHYIGMVVFNNLIPTRLIGTLLSLTSMAVLAVGIGWKLFTR